eukprot:g32352.t1
MLNSFVSTNLSTIFSPLPSRRDAGLPIDAEFGLEITGPGDADCEAVGSQISYVLKELGQPSFCKDTRLKDSRGSLMSEASSLERRRARDQEQVAEMRSSILRGQLEVMIFNKRLQPEARRLGLNPGRMQILRADGSCEDSWDVKQLQCISFGIASNIVPKPPPAEKTTLGWSDGAMGKGCADFLRGGFRCLSVIAYLLGMIGPTDDFCKRGLRTYRPYGIQRFVKISSKVLSFRFHFQQYGSEARYLCAMFNDGTTCRFAAAAFSQLCGLTNAWGVEVMFATLVAYLEDVHLIGHAALIRRNRQVEAISAAMMALASQDPGDLGRTNRRGPSPPTTPMRAMSAELSSTAAACGLPERLLGYLKDKRVLSVGLLAAMVDSYKEIDELLYQPLLDGTEIEGHEWKIDPEEGPVVRAALRFLWKQCRDKESQAGTSSGDPSQGPGIPSTNPGMGITDGTNTKPAPNVPREIPPPELQKLLKYYADTEIAGRHRDFPMRALAGDEKINIREALARQDWRAESSNLLRNGWGFVIRKPNNECYYAHGEIPGTLLGKFTTRRAFIYALEIIAQLLCLIAGQSHMERMSLCFIDNEPGKFALQKGYGRDTRVNRLLAMLWQFVETSNHIPHWERVTSQANISDAISRGDFSMAETMNWRALSFDWNGLYDTLTRATASMEAAMTLGKALAAEQLGPGTTGLERPTWRKNTRDAAVAPCPKKGR